MGDAHGMDKDPGLSDGPHPKGHNTVRVATAPGMQLALAGVNVTAVEFASDRGMVDVAWRRRRLVCPHCADSTRLPQDTQAPPSAWRELDLGSWRVSVGAQLHRLRCPTDGVDARGGAVRPSRHRRDPRRRRPRRLAGQQDGGDCDQPAACASTGAPSGSSSNGSSLTSSIATASTGCIRSASTLVSYRKAHHDLTIVADHRSGTVVSADEGTDTQPPAREHRCGHGREVQGRPLGAAETTRRPHRRPARHAARPRGSAAGRSGAPTNSPKPSGPSSARTYATPTARSDPTSPSAAMSSRATSPAASSWTRSSSAASAT